MIHAKMNDKYCTKCKEIKPTNDFHNNRSNKDGKADWCKLCNAARAFKFLSTPGGVEAKKVSQKKYSLSDKGRATRDKASKVYAETHPDRYRAKCAVNSAVQNGTIDKPDFCSVCFGKGVIHGHHHDYTKPLDVQWLCQPCHINVHHGE